MKRKIAMKIGGGFCNKPEVHVARQTAEVDGYDYGYKFLCARSSRNYQPFKKGV